MYIWNLYLFFYSPFEEDGILAAVCIKVWTSIDGDVVNQHWSVITPCRTAIIINQLKNIRKGKNRARLFSSATECYYMVQYTLTKCGGKKKGRKFK